LVAVAPLAGAAARCRSSRILLLFLVGPWFGWWLVKGNLNYSLTLKYVLPLADPLVLLQSLLARHVPERNAIIGVSWFCCFMGWWAGAVLRVGLSGQSGDRCGQRDAPQVGHSRWRRLPRQTRYWLLGLILVLAATTGTIVWELVNPVSMLPRGLMFGMGAGWLLIGGIFLFDLFVMKRGWCSHVCPVGAFYSLIGRFSLLRVTAAKRDACHDCLDCFAVCPSSM
jgi:ferredoxin-type protein NapH